METEVKNEIKNVFDETVADYKKSVEEQKAKIEDLEHKVKTLETKKIHMPTFIMPETYKGYNLSHQMEAMRESAIKAGKNPDLLTPIAKAMIDFGHAVAKGDNSVTLAKAAASHIEGTDEKGGYLVMEEFDRELIKLAREFSVMPALVNQVNVGKTDTFKFNKALTEVSVSWDTEGSVTKKSTTFERGTIGVNRLSGYVDISRELLDDSAYDLAGALSEQFAYAIAQEEDNQILNGTGSPCSGILSAAAGYSVVIGTAGSGAWSSITGDIFSSAMTKLSGVDRTNGTFVLGDKGAHYLRTLKDTANAPIYQSIAGPDLDTLWGKKMVVANKIDDSTGGTGGYYAVFGDMKQFYLINRLGDLDLLVDPYSDSISWNVRFIFAKRLGLGIKRSTGFCRIGTN